MYLIVRDFLLHVFCLNTFLTHNACLHPILPSATPTSLVLANLQATYKGKLFGEELY